MWWFSESWLTAFKVLKEQFRNFSPHKAWKYSALNILLDPSFHINFQIMTIVKLRYVNKLRSDSISFKSLPCWKHHSSLRSHFALEVGSSFQNSMGWEVWNRRPKAIARVGIAATSFSNWACISVHLKSWFDSNPRLVPMFPWVKSIWAYRLPDPHLLGMHWTYSAAIAMQGEKELSSWCPKSHASSFPHLGILHLPRSEHRLQVPPCLHGYGVISTGLGEDPVNPCSVFPHTM